MPIADASRLPPHPKARMEYGTWSSGRRVFLIPVPGRGTAPRFPARYAARLGGVSVASDMAGFQTGYTEKGLLDLLNLKRVA
ncbi:hypothetical protein SGFS_064120 [Streptomyces graminofaciens]|uniref:Uncharacterized protein n=1 Tax=Streptomyces graminofaciens TaxID=68212 RepID=A0ABM9SCA7_9ACTN|nr:hypothetical protein SGFS_064120 [Streptomyces graminofaciens]